MSIKEDILKNVGNEQLLFRVLVEKKIGMEVSGGQKTVWFPTFLKNMLFCVQHKKETHTGSEVEGESMMTEFSFWGVLTLLRVRCKVFFVFFHTSLPNPKK